MNTLALLIEIAFYPIPKDRIEIQQVGCGAISESSTT
jgi:hypothetical protein